MHNINYNLIKMLHGKLDDLWRIQKHYLKDATKVKCGCAKILRVIEKDVAKHIKLLKTEMAKHIGEKKFE